MRNFILLLVIALATTNAIAQKAPDRFYYKDGSRVEGLLAFIEYGDRYENKTQGHWAVSYRPSKKTKKSDKKIFTTRDICCFVIGADSFSIIKDVKPYGLFTVTAEQDFAKVLEAGKINLYKYKSVMHGASGNPMTGMHQTSRAVEEYVIEKDGKSELVNEMQFQKQMEGYIGDYPALMDRIRKGQLDYRRAKDDTQVIIKFYNDWAKMVPR